MGLKLIMFSMKVTTILGIGEMKITLNEVKNVFKDVIDGKCSREDADRWAYAYIKNEDLGELEFSPLTEREKIWSGLNYLYGIDLKSKPNEYLHSKDDIINVYLDLLNDT
jgi:hypothetical protein